MRRLWNSFKIAFSMYSKIPVPQSDWAGENMRYVMCFFPLVGLAIGGLTLLWREASGYFGLAGTPFSAIVLLLIPVAVTGGIHLDGLLDTADAMHSYLDKEKRLEILKDPRAGAFAVLTAAVYFLFYYGIYSCLEPQTGAAADGAWRVIALSFVVSRALSGYAVVAFPKAKDTGLAAMFADESRLRIVKISLQVILLAAASAMLCLHTLYGAAALAAAVVVFFRYRRMSREKFGGITGDLAGWFLQNCELWMAFAVTAADIAVNTFMAGGMG